MTGREKQILEIIQEDPMISQEDLAKRLDITRTSVAVHISNLIKKGYIIGKGYVTNNSSYVSIVGGVNIDIGGKPSSELVKSDSNPGSVNITVGGVGRNIAHNLSLLGVNTKLFTAMGSDLYAEKIKESCKENNIDISNAKIIEGGKSSVYLFIADESGNMIMAISDMDICEKINIPYLSSNLKSINSSPLLLIDANIPQESIEYLCDNVNVPIFADPVSTKKAVKFKNVLSKIHTLKPNLIEAELLSEIKIEDRLSLIKAGSTLLEKGVKRVFISLGAKGVFVCDEKTRFIMSPYPAQTINTTGAGDAFTSGLIYSYLSGYDITKTCKYAQACAALATESKETINENISVKKAENKIDSYVVNIENI